MIGLVHGEHVTVTAACSTLLSLPGLRGHRDMDPVPSLLQATQGVAHDTTWPDEHGS
jgi:hypothetical protein